MDMTFVAGHRNYYEPFYRFGAVTNNPQYIEQCKLVVFTGGADVDPLIYGSHHNPKTGRDSARDLSDMDIFYRARDAHLPMTGICRGSQFLCAMAGGKLIQHVERHGISGTHKITTDDGRKIDVTSTHHQMAYPWNVEHTLLAYAEALSSVYENTGPLDEYSFPKHATLPNGLIKEPEAVYYPSINALGCQWHPEYMPRDSAGMLYYQELVQLLLEGELK